MPVLKSPKSSIRWISSKEMAKIIDSRARAVLRVSGKTFVRRRMNGKYAKLDADACPGIVELALIAPAIKGGRRIAGKNSKRSR